VKTSRGDRIYLDAVTAAPVERVATEAYMASVAEGWAEPGRVHAESHRAQRMLDDAREEVAALLGTRASHTHFAPSPAIAAERIVMGIASARKGRTRGLVNASEPRSITNAARLVCADGVITSPLDRDGALDINAFSRGLSQPDIAFAAVSPANAEVGTLHPLDHAYAAALSVKVPLVVDASASIGRVRPPKAWDALVANPAAWGGPGGMSVLALKPELRWLPEWADGAPWAPGSTSVPAAVAAATALRSRHRAMLAGSENRLRDLAGSLVAALRTIPHTVILGGTSAALPHVVAVNFVYTDSAAVARELDEHGIAVGAGCNCGDANPRTCGVLRAMGAMTHGFVRFGLHEGIDAATLKRAVVTVSESVARVRAKAGAPT
jgi:cysteine desulfurase